MGKDTVWLRGERAPRKDVAILDENAVKFVFEEKGKKVEVEGWRVRSVRHADSPPELAQALARIPQGDFATAEKALEALSQRENAPAWLKTHASFHQANARRLRASLEGTGNEEAVSLLEKWFELEKGTEHWLHPSAALAWGEAALAGGLEAGPAFRLLEEGHASASWPWRLLGEWGRGSRLMQAQEFEKAASLFEKLETTALAQEYGHEAAQLARIGRAEALGKLGKTREGAQLLAEAVDYDAWQGTPARARGLNVLADLVCDLGGRNPDGTPTPAGLIAALPFWTKVVRYSSHLPLERARALAGAHKASLAAGATGRAAHMKKELTARFPSSKWAKGV
jgi:tetratricopeptide (TPR) repeat protein